MKVSTFLHVVMIAAAWSGTACARPSNEVSTEYYAEAQLQHLVGERILTCSGGRAKWGRVTAFSLRESVPCGTRRVRTESQTKAARLLLHHDPLLTCRAQCEKKFHIPTACTPDGCDTRKAECLSACADLLEPSVPPEEMRSP